MEQLTLFEEILNALQSDSDQAVEIEEILSADHYPHIADALLVCTIREAFGESRGGPRFGRGKKDDAWAWIERDLGEGKSDAFSFHNCCIAAGVDPVELQDMLKLRRANEAVQS